MNLILYIGLVFLALCGIIALIAIIWYHPLIAVGIAVFLVLLGLFSEYLKTD